MGWNWDSEKTKEAITYLFNDYVLDITNSPKNVEDLKIYLKCQIMKFEGEVSSRNKDYESLSSKCKDKSVHMITLLDIIKRDIASAEEKIKLCKEQLNFITNLESLFNNHTVVKVIEEQQKQRKESLKAIRNALAECDKNDIIGDVFTILDSMIERGTVESTEKLIESMILTVAMPKIFPNKYNNLKPIQF